MVLSMFGKGKEKGKGDKTPKRLSTSQAIASDAKLGSREEGLLMERTPRGLAIQSHSEGGGTGRDQRAQRRRGNLYQYQRDLVPDRLHRRAHSNAAATGPMPGPGQNGNPTASGKKGAQARKLSSDSSLSKNAHRERERENKQHGQQRPSMRAGRLNGPAWK